MDMKVILKEWLNYTHIYVFLIFVSCLHFSPYVHLCTQIHMHCISTGRRVTRKAATFAWIIATVTLPLLTKYIVFYYYTTKTIKWKYFIPFLFYPIRILLKSIKYRKLMDTVKGFYVIFLPLWKAA